MIYLYIFTGIVFIASVIKDIDKTKRALKIAVKKLLKILPSFVQMLILVSIILYLVPDRVIVKYLGESSKSFGLLAGLFFGSITIMPGFIAFPLGGILVSKGVSYMNVAAFTTTLMLVGLITYPVEKEYFGIRLTIIRNIISLIVAVIITLMVGLFYGEVI